MSTVLSTPFSTVPAPTPPLSVIPASVSPSSPLPPPPPPTASPSSNANSNSGNVIDSGALYLYTFLATLVLLLSVSCAIVVRSLVVRRRRNRLIAEAIANGSWVPRGPPRDPGTKPSMFEAYVADLKHAASHDELDWDAITPFSATYVNNPSIDPVSEKTAPASTPSRSPLARLFTAFPISRPSPPRVLLPLAASSSPSSTHSQPSTRSSPSTSSPTTNTPPSGAITPSSTLRLAILIAMPSPHNASQPRGGVLGTGAGASASNNDDNDKENIPHVEFGVTEVGVGPPSASDNSTAVNADVHNGGR